MVRLRWCMNPCTAILYSQLFCKAQASQLGPGVLCCLHGLYSADLGVVIWRHGASWGSVGASWGVVRPRARKIRSGFPSGHSLGAVLGASWAVLEASWGRLGGILGRLGASWRVSRAKKTEKTSNINPPASARMKSRAPCCSRS